MEMLNGKDQTFQVGSVVKLIRDDDFIGRSLENF